MYTRYCATLNSTPLGQHLVVHLIVGSSSTYLFLITGSWPRLTVLMDSWIVVAVVAEFLGFNTYLCLGWSGAVWRCLVRRSRCISYGHWLCGAFLAGSLFYKGTCIRPNMIIACNLILLACWLMLYVIVCLTIYVINLLCLYYALLFCKFKFKLLFNWKHFPHLLSDD